MVVMILTNGAFRIATEPTSEEKMREMIGEMIYIAWII